MVKPQITIILTRVPTTSARWYPNDKTLVAGLWAIVNDTIDIAKPTKSEARCAVSVKIAIELDRIPPMIYAIMKNTDTNETSISFFRAFRLFSEIYYFLALKLIGVLTGIGVPIASGISNLYYWEAV